MVRWWGRAADDVFPTRYRANSPGDIQALAARAGLEVVRIDLIEGRPEYLSFSAPTYLLGWLYARVQRPRVTWFGSSRRQWLDPVNFFLDGLRRVPQVNRPLRVEPKFRGVPKQSAQANRHRWTQGATFFQ